MGAAINAPTILPWERFAAPTGLSDYRSLLQTAWDAAASRGRALLVSYPAVYPMTVVGSGTDKYCLTPTDPTKRYGLILAPGVNLQLAASQLSDGSAVSVIRVADHTGGGYIGWPLGGRGGKITGNTANQPAWTTASGEGGTRYTQADGSAGIRGADTIGNGSRDWTADNLELSDFFAHPMVWVGDPTGRTYNAGSYDIHARRIYIKDVGEGIHFSSIQNCSMLDIEDVWKTNIRVGDGCELSHCTDFTVRNLYAHTWDGNTMTGGGASVDAYASRRGVISGIRALEVGQGVTLQSAFGFIDTDYCDDITVSDCVFRRISSQTIMPAETGTSRWNNILIDGRGDDGGSSAGIDCSACTTNALVYLSNVCAINGAKPIDIGQGYYSFDGVQMLDPGPSPAAACTIGNGKTPILDWNRVRLRSSEAGLDLSGNAAPTGVILNSDFRGTGGGFAKRCRNTSTLAGVEIPHGLRGTDAGPPILLPATADLLPYQGEREVMDVYGGGPVTTLGVGHKGQILRVWHNYAQTTTYVHSTNLKLAGGVNASFDANSFIEFAYRGGAWLEIGRSKDYT